jgi:hypothetical protein
MADAFHALMLQRCDSDKHKPFRFSQANGVEASTLGGHSLCEKQNAWVITNIPVEI